MLIPARPRRRLLVVALVAALAMGGAAAFTVDLINATTTKAGPTCSGKTYTVVSGDAWTLIARRHAVTLDALLSANGATTATMLHPGQRLCLPPGAVTPTSTTTTKPSSSTTTTLHASGASSTTGPSTSVPPLVRLSHFPVQGVCGFADSWGAPRSGGRRHEGVDIIARANKYVYAVTDGTLTRKYVDRPGALAGNGWRLTAADGTYFFYGHFSAFAPGLDVGSKVKAGQVIGFIGMTGAAGTPHLHFEIHPGGGKAVNPTPSVQAVDACDVTTPPAQPGGAAPPPQPAPTTSPSTPTTVRSAISTSVVPSSSVRTTAPTPTTVVAPAPTSGLWHFRTPVKVIDTRGERLAAGVTRTVQVRGVAGIPSTTRAVLVRMVATGVEQAGTISVHSCDDQPSVPSMRIRPGLVNASTAIVSLTGGTLCMTSSQSIEMKAHVVALIADGYAGYGVEPLLTRRAIDTRATGRLEANQPTTLSLTALGASAGSRAVTATVSLLKPDGAGALAIGPCGGSPWVVPFEPAVVQSFSVVIRINDAGLCATSTTGTHVVVDVSAVWRGNQKMAATSPTTLFDSARHGKVSTAPVKVNVPGGTAVDVAQLTVSVNGGNVGAAVFVWPCSAKKPVAAVAATPRNTWSSVNVTVAVGGGAVCVAASSKSSVVISTNAHG